ncbi:putative nuclear mrna splicing factor-associated protein [Staphylotrichum tortipilum]|uniref:Nuclear mrna splicing factor-associated protein n=1 Tax=Staphylotrichum tortipilum TaxID=2831512 RepID=A0AAN6M9U0_9PEZI|nr:putative nuclear mrna splicing factor-associated protein [Staphylotrichum longicolle]
MVPTDGNFPSSKTNGRIFVLKFASSSQRHLFWLQSKPQGRSGNPAWISPRDLMIGDIVDRLLQGDEVDVNQELGSIVNNDDDSRRDADDDETMEDIEGHGEPHAHRRGGNGGAGPDATGGDFRQEGSDSREGGADGARAASNDPNDAAAAVRNFLDSLKGGAPSLSARTQAQGKAYPLLNDLLDPPTTIAMLDAADDAYIDNLLTLLPPTVVALSAPAAAGGAELTPEAAAAAMSSGQKRTLLKKVLRSPQFSQALAGLTAALRDGGLPSIAEALGVELADGGRVRGGTVPLGGGEAVEAFVEGVKRGVEKNERTPYTANKLYWSFPTNTDEFDQDDRISYSKLDNKYIAVQDDGTEYEFDQELKRWIPMIDEALIEEQQRGYMMHNADADEPRPRQQQQQQQGKKRKMDYSNDREQDNNTHNNHPDKKDRASKNPRRGGQGSRGPPQPKQNTAVYVTGLPPDATADEVAELFSRKCGVIAEEIDSGRPRIKMYTDGATGRFKGDALIVFFKPQSVQMAIMLLDDTDFRFPTGPPGSAVSAPKMRVQAADASYKKTKYDGDDTPSSSSKPNNSNPSSKPPPNTSSDKAKIIRKTQKLSAKLADWSDDDLPPSHASNPTPSDAPSTKTDRTIILTHMFTFAELASDPTALLDIKEDVRDECAKLGPVTNVVLYDEEEDGIVAACLRLMHGRAFAGRIVEAYFATGKEKFRRSKGEVGAGGGDGDEEE